MKLLVFGSLNIDHVYHLPHLVREGETISSECYERNEGGKGFNQAVALAKAGQEVWMAGAIGSDGVFLKNELDELGINTSLIKQVNAPTGHAVIQVDANGNNSIVLYGGANYEITTEMIDEVLSHFTEGDYVLMQNEISHGDVLISKAKGQGLRVILNPSPVTNALEQWPLHLVDTLILNEVEGKDLTGKDDPNEIISTLLSRYPACRIVLTLGADGSMYADETQRGKQPSILVQTVDTTAAGDTFTGYFIHSVFSGKTMEKSLLRAAHAAAITVSKAGAAKSIPFAHQVDEG